MSTVNNYELVRMKTSYLLIDHLKQAKRGN